MVSQDVYYVKDLYSAVSFQNQVGIYNIENTIYVNEVFLKLSQYWKL